MRYWPGLLGICLLLGGCQEATSLAEPTGTSETTTEAIETTDPATSAEVPANAQIPTQPLIPTPINISLASLPEPFASESASQPPNVIAPPEAATLSVPEGFSVNIFAEGLDQPRWLALTPDGDVLVTETRQNRIRRLIDADGDGVAETQETFATSRNGLNIPFGMAFADGAFFLGNTDEVVRFPFVPGQTALEGKGDHIADLPGGGYNQH
ncbi:MAG: hypothetical protein WBD47_00520, partial [Phormidesmis sp.]